MSNHQVLLVALVLATGCGTFSMRFTRPPTGVEPSGEPLSVREVTRAHASSERRAVGEVHYQTSSGASAGSATVYQDVPVTRYETNWFLFQGEDQIDDVDFYAIARDDAAAEQAARYRSSGLIFTWLGIGLDVAGLGATLGLSALKAGAWTYVGLIGPMVGTVLMLLGQHRLEPGHHAFNSVRAINTANAYNRSRPRAAR